MRFDGLVTNQTLLKEIREEVRALRQMAEAHTQHGWGGSSTANLIEPS